MCFGGGGNLCNVTESVGLFFWSLLTSHQEAIRELPPESRAACLPEARRARDRLRDTLIALTELQTKAEEAKSESEHLNTVAEGLYRQMTADYSVDEPSSVADSSIVASSSVASTESNIAEALNQELLSLFGSIKAAISAAAGSDLHTKKVRIPYWRTTLCCTGRRFSLHRVSPRKNM